MHVKFRIHAAPAKAAAPEWHHLRQDNLLKAAYRHMILCAPFGRDLSGKDANSIPILGLSQPP